MTSPSSSGNAPEKQPCARCGTPVTVTAAMRRSAAKVEQPTEGYLCDDCILQVIRMGAARRRGQVVKK